MRTSQRRLSKGFSLIELMVALAIMSVGMLGFVGAFSYLSRSISNARARTIASNLGQEKQEQLKKISYYRLVVTTAPVYATEQGISVFPYDSTYYPEESIVVAGTPFIRRVYIEKVQEDTAGFVSVDPAQPDTGMKKITVYVMWRIGAAGNYLKQEVRSLYSNPSRQALGSRIKGRVTVGGVTPVADVRVECLQNTSFFDATDSNGDYAFRVTPGTYTLRASKDGYYTAYSASLYAAAASTTTKDMSISVIATGDIVGRPYLNNHLVLSAVVGSTVALTGKSYEYVSVFNPTTMTWTMTDVGLKYARPGKNEKAIDITYVNTTIAPYGFFLFANTTTFTSGGATVTSDAYWAASNSSYSEFDDFNANILRPNNIIMTSDLPSQGAGSLRLYQISTGATLDLMGWDRNAGGQSAPYYETDGLNENVGLEPAERYYRHTSTNAYSASFGPAYDTGNNVLDWAQENPLTQSPRGTFTGTLPVISGSPGFGTVVSCDDGLSSPATAQTYTAATGRTYAEFRLTSVATGTYNVALSSGSLYQQVSTVTVTTGATTFIQNSATTPAWPVAGYNNAFLDGTSTNGYIAGKVRNIYSTPLSGKKVEAGGVVATTGSDGSYIMAVPEGTYTVTANPDTVAGYDSSYVSYAHLGIPVTVGDITNGTDFILSQGGELSGFITTNGTDPLPNVVVIAKTGGVEYASALSGSDGRFELSNLSTGTYTVEPQLDRGETVSPSSPTASVTLGVNTFTSTFTVTGAFGSISGTLKDNGQSIVTGVLMMATTGTISADPPSDTASLRSGTLLYYATSSLADGTYRLEVRGSASGTTYNVYAWYTKWSGTTPTTVRKTTTATVVAGGTQTKHLTWP